jgi:hypothetical protein
MQYIDYPPPATSTFRRGFIVVVAGAGLIVGLGVSIALSAFTTVHAKPLSPLEQQQFASRLAAAQAPAAPNDSWVESRDGDGALDVEDVNGAATIYFDKQSRTRMLCVDHTGCYHLRGHHESSK